MAPKVANSNLAGQAGDRKLSLVNSAENKAVEEDGVALPFLCCAQDTVGR